MNWIANEDTIIFDARFNTELDIELISNYSKLIFSDYELNEKIFEYCANNNFDNLQYVKSKFNKDVSILPQLLL